MAERTLFGVGAIGDVVKRIQLALQANGGDLKPDRIYGNDTSNAVKEFQTASNISVTGAVDDATWQLLLQEPVPAVSERSLQLTAAFEGHGFELAVGNFDGALLTWGIIGFTLSAGEVQSIVLAINDAHPELVKGSFGDKTNELLQLMNADGDFQEKWADEHTLGNGSL